MVLLTRLAPGYRYSAPENNDRREIDKLDALRKDTNDARPLQLLTYSPPRLSRWSRVQHDQHGNANIREKRDKPRGVSRNHRRSRVHPACAADAAGARRENLVAPDHFSRGLGWPDLATGADRRAVSYGDRCGGRHRHADRYSSARRIFEQRSVADRDCLHVCAGVREDGIGQADRSIDDSTYRNEFPSS